MIVITAPTGNIGSQVLPRVLNGGGAVRVIARDPAKLPPGLRGRVEIVEGSHHERDTVMRAFEGAEAVFWLMTGDPGAASAEESFVDRARPGCAAMRACGVRRVVGISALGRGWPGEAGHVTATLKLDDMIAATGVAYRALACGSLMENMLRQAAAIRDRGEFYWPTPGDRKTTAVATRDVAALAARLLLDTSWGGVESIPLAGPEALSFDDMARIMSDVLEKPVAFRQISMDDMKAMLLSRGTSQGMAQAMLDMLAAKNAGLDDAAPRTDARDTPTTFRQWCAEVLKPAIAG